MMLTFSSPQIAWAREINWWNCCELIPGGRVSGSPETRALLVLFGILSGMDLFVLPLRLPCRPFELVAVGAIMFKEIKEERRVDKKDR